MLQIVLFVRQPKTFTKAYIGYLISNLVAKGQVRPTSSDNTGHLLRRLNVKIWRFLYGQRYYFIP